LHTSSKGTKIAGHITYVAHDFFQVEIDSPFSELRDGFIHDLTEVPKEYWYVQDGKITKDCRKEARRLLVELYRIASFFENERKAIQRILLDAIALGNEYYATLGTSDDEIAEAIAIDTKGRIRNITDPEMLALFKDTRSFEEQRDWHILNRFSYQVYFYHKQPIGSWATLATLIKRHYGVSLIYPDRLGEFISERLKENEGRK
jgi:hypothetical protein